jgi:hypothetical protein
MSRLSDYRALMRTLDPGRDPRMAFVNDWVVDRPSTEVPKLARQSDEAVNVPASGRRRR